MDTPDHKEIYKNQARKYDELITKEDYEKNLLTALKDIIDFKDRDIIDLGAGTGRITVMLASFCRTIKACDQSPHMLGIAREKLNKLPYKNWEIIVGDNRFVPLKDNMADIVISGWSVGYLIEWSKNNWTVEVDKVLNEMKRLLRSKGMIIIIESLGTGMKTPQAPNKDLEDYYSYLEKQGFFRIWIRTDYKFNSFLEGERLVKNFFGHKMIDKIERNDILLLPECTGIWFHNI